MQGIKSKINKIILKYLIILHSYCYYKISKFVLLVNNGIHPKHEIMKYYQFFLDNIEPTERILDLGCGNGYLTNKIAEKAKSVTAIDLNQANINYAKNNFNKKNIKYVFGDITKFMTDDKFDKIILSNVLEHIEDREKFLNELHRLSGIVLLRVPLENRDWLTIYKKNHGYKYMLDFSHYIEYTFQSLEKELKQAGWKINKFQIIYGELWGVIKSNYEN